MVPDVRFGSKADMCSARGYVRFTPNSDRECGFPQTVMSALPPKADMCGAGADVRFGPIADMPLLPNAHTALYPVMAGRARIAGVSPNEIVLRSSRVLTTALA